MQDKKAQKWIKRIFDVAIAFVVLFLFLPVWILIAILIKATSPGPIFFLQRRPGYKRKIFKVYKFRTMVPGSDVMIKGQEVFKDDSRITAIGRFLRRSKLDEVPQILNVLLGDMSLVGPRPERIESLTDYTDEVAKRLDMKPGLTGLAQVSGNIYIPLSERYRFDVYYIEHFSLWLDLKIIIRTIGVVLFGEQRYLNNSLIDIYHSKNESLSSNRSISK